jgi:tetratricopeptide (TPR) repeat protein
VRPRGSPLLLVLLPITAAVMCACAHRPAGSPDDAPTVKSLESRHLEVAADQGPPPDDQKSIAAYRDFLKAAPQAPQRTEAMRRLADLQMDNAEPAVAGAAPPAPGSKEAQASSDYRNAITLYLDLLKSYPNDPGNDRVLYQLARAYEQGGDLDASLKTLARLVQQYPATAYRDEAQFRRGEMLFSTRNYPKAEEAYATILHGDPTGPYYERALYMDGWSVFKQGRLEESLHSFFGVLDLKLAGRSNEGDLESIPGLTRADRELVEDTFRVASLCLENLHGAESIPPFISSPVRHEYESRVYEQLAGLYLKQDRTKDAADTFTQFVRANPLHPQTPIMQARVIDIYQQAGFTTLAFATKKDYVARYGAKSDFRRANPAAWERTQPLVKTHLAELTRYYHAAAQKSRRNEDYQEAVRWYRAYLESFPSDPQAAQTNFLLAELLFEDGAIDPARYPEAAAEYEKAAYQYPRHAKSADAGYSALLAYAEQEKRTPAAAQPAVQQAEIESAKRFFAAFPDDPRRALVLTHAAEQLYALHQPEPAAALAQQVLALDPPAPAAQRRTAWTVVAYAAFDQNQFDLAERAYTETLALTPADDPKRAELGERLAAAIYKQGEQARAAGKMQEAASDFGRVAAAAPQSAVRPTAQYDAAAALISLKDWDGAARMLEDFRRRYPNHPLQTEVSRKLAAIYLERKQWALAAAEMERLAADRSDPRVARDAAWQAAELYEKGGARAPAAAAYEHYVRQYPDPFETACEARYRLAKLAHDDGNRARELAWMGELLQADQAGGAARTDRTRYLGATAALALAEPQFEEFQHIALVEPLQKQLKLKKAKMEEVLRAYGVASAYGVADVATAATYKTAELYHEFGRALLASERPKGLGKDELEQYNVLLEEQADPFEAKAVEVHELNARRSAEGIYDKSVKDSYRALRELRPLRYGKSEIAEVVVDAIR